MSSERNDEIVIDIDREGNITMDVESFEAYMGGTSESSAQAARARKLRGKPKPKRKTKTLIEAIDAIADKQRRAGLEPLTDRAIAGILLARAWKVQGGRPRNLEAAYRRVRRARRRAALQEGSQQPPWSAWTCLK